MSLKQSEKIERVETFKIALENISAILETNSLRDEYSHRPNMFGSRFSTPPSPSQKQMDLTKIQESIGETLKLISDMISFRGEIKELDLYMDNLLHTLKHSFDVSERTFIPLCHLPPMTVGHPPINNMRGYFHAEMEDKDMLLDFIHMYFDKLNNGLMLSDSPAVLNILSFLHTSIYRAMNNILQYEILKENEVVRLEAIVNTEKLATEAIVFVDKYLPEGNAKNIVNVLLSKELERLSILKNATNKNKEHVGYHPSPSGDYNNDFINPFSFRQPDINPSIQNEVRPYHMGVNSVEDYNRLKEEAHFAPFNHPMGAPFDRPLRPGINVGEMFKGPEPAFTNMFSGMNKGYYSDSSQIDIDLKKSVLNLDPDQPELDVFILSPHNMNMRDDKITIVDNLGPTVSKDFLHPERSILELSRDKTFLDVDKIIKRVVNPSTSTRFVVSGLESLIRVPFYARVVYKYEDIPSRVSYDLTIIL